MCESLYLTNQDTFLKCGHKFSIASLADNSHGPLKFHYGFVNNINIRLLRNSGSSVLGVVRKDRKGKGHNGQECQMCNIW